MNLKWTVSIVLNPVLLKQPAVLRRVPDHVFVRSIDDPDVALLVGLAREKGIVVTEMGEPYQYRAVTIIKKVL